MRKQQIENAAFEVATQVRAVEDSIDSALAEMAELQARILRANALAHVGYDRANPALEQLATAINGLVTVRGGVARCHAELADAKQFVPGLRTVAFGEGHECPDQQMASNPLRIVA